MPVQSLYASSGSAPSMHDEVVRYLKEPHAFPWSVKEVSVRQTHGAVIFLAGDKAVKIKKPVQFSYMDFSTLEKRESGCRREFELNRKHAPQIYLGVFPITCDALGRFNIAGRGEVVEWCLLMQRFDERNLLSSRLRADTLTARHIDSLAEKVALSHEQAPCIHNANSVLTFARVIDDICHHLEQDTSGVAPDLVRSFRKCARHKLSDVALLLSARELNGFVRRCHGDLHLENIVLLKETPVLFDALEFDESLATIDIFYDLAFLLMDMISAGYGNDAAHLFNRYVARSNSLNALAGLQAMPLFLALRAGIRAMVAVDRAAQSSGSDREEAEKKAQHYLDHAVNFLSPQSAALVAVGGYSGTGKSTLAASLSQSLGQAPGAVILRSDVERKQLAGVAETSRLPEEYYTPEMSEQVFAQLSKKAGAALRAGYSVIVDAAYLRVEERSSIEALASSLKVPFTGLWLTGPQSILEARVSARKGDASDATKDVVAKQFDKKIGPVSWDVIDASGSAEDTLEAALAVLFSDTRTGGDLTDYLSRKRA